jgi:hypothetical protein
MKHQHPVRILGDQPHAVRNHQDGMADPIRAADEIHHCAQLVVIEACGGLVENDEFGLSCEDGCNRQLLLQFMLGRLFLLPSVRALPEWAAQDRRSFTPSRKPRSKALTTLGSGGGFTRTLNP